MGNFIHDHSWFDIIKDIVIPVLSLSATVIIGIMIAFILKRKEERIKIKSLLIDTYLIFISEKRNLIFYWANTICFTIYSELLKHDSTVFDHNALFNSPVDEIIKEKLLKKKDAFKSIAEGVNAKQIKLMDYEHEFRFLLGSEKYNQSLDALVKKINKSFLIDPTDKDDDLVKFIRSIYDSVILNNDIIEYFKSDDPSDIEVAFNLIEHIVEIKLKEKFEKIFAAYITKLEEQIDLY